MKTSGGSALRKVTGLLGLLVGSGILLVGLWLLYQDISHPHSRAQGLWFMAVVPGVMLLIGAIGTARGSQTSLYVLLGTNTLMLALGMAAVNGRIVSSNGGANFVLLLPAALEVCVLALLVINEQKQRDA